ncbi:DIP2 disco-interacting protein 2 C [Cichlidogyrus casuarinus]|uniref:DIP2 disco-interacting protein 2 C n=1 Tax=Cichlidogyrus casuarinus TaxID=1844966 RepID=A0ABD2QQJ5_9PLAT
MLPLVTNFPGNRSSASFENAPNNFMELVRNFNLQPSDSMEELDSSSGNDLNYTGACNTRGKVQRTHTVICKDRVSDKILKLVHTLKNPKRSSTSIDYFRDEDDQLLAKISLDPNAPKPTGSSNRVISGDHLITPSGLPKNLECAVRQYGTVAEKQPALSCANNKASIKDSVTFSKFEKLAMKVAFYLSDKLTFGPNREYRLKRGDRIALTYASNEPIPFIIAFYGSLMASLIPIAIEVPSVRRDGSCRSMGFLMSSLNINVVLTSEQCYRSLRRNPANNEILPLPGWPQIKDVKVPKDWTPPPRLESHDPLYLEYTYTREGSVRAVNNNRAATLEHCRALTAACSYTESDVMVCVVDSRREAGLWHCVLTSMFNGVHVIFVPHSVMQVNPGAWLAVVTRYQATVAIVRGRDMQWGMLAEDAHAQLSLSSLRMILVTDGANPWTLNTCDEFVRKFSRYGLSQDVICPAAHSTEGLTAALRRPLSRALSLQRIVTADPNTFSTTANSMPPVSSGHLCMYALSHGKIQLNPTNEINSLTVTDCGLVLPGTLLVTVRLGTQQPTICKTDELGEICICNAYTATGYWGLEGASKARFGVVPVDEDGRAVAPGKVFTRTGLLGFLGLPLQGPGGGFNSLIFVVGTTEGLLSVEGRRHNADDLVATVLAIPRREEVFRSRVCVFSVPILKDERVVIVAELRDKCSDAAAFCWMSTVIQTVGHIHKDLSVYCIALVPQNSLPKTAFGGIAVHEVRRLFTDGNLHPSVLLLCPHSSIHNLPQARSAVPIPVGPSAMMVGQVVQGSRFAEVSGRSLNISVADGSPPEIRILPAILTWRAEHTPNDVLFTVYKANPRAQPLGSVSTANVPPLVAHQVTSSQLLSRVECIKTLLHHRANLRSRSVVAIMYQPGIEMIAAFYACQFLGHIPVVVRPPLVSRKSPTDQPTQESSRSPLLRMMSCTGLSGEAAEELPPNTVLTRSSDAGSSSSLSCSLGNLNKCYLSRANHARFASEVSMEHAFSIVQHSRASLVLTNGALIKQLKAKTAHIPLAKWPKMYDTEEAATKKKPTQNVSMASLHNSVAYIDFSISTTGTFSGSEITHKEASILAHAQKLQCELYPGMKVLLCLEPFSGLSLSLWAMTSVYCGHHSVLVPPTTLESNPDLWLAVRDMFVSYPVMEQSLFRLMPHIGKLKRRELRMNGLRNVIAICEERPRVSFAGTFSKVFSSLGLSPRAVSSSFGCRVNQGICLQGSTNPDLSTVYVDKISLRNDRIKVVEKGTPNSICLQESGKLLPGVEVVIANPDTLGQCSNSQLGEIWISSAHNCSSLLGPFQMTNCMGDAPGESTTTASSIAGTQSSTASSMDDLRTPDSRPLLPASGVALSNLGCPDQLKAKLATGQENCLGKTYARTGFLGFVKRTDRTEADGHLHDALFVVGSMEEALCLRGMRYHPSDVEGTVLRAHKHICQSAVFTWSSLLVVVVELFGGQDHEALDLVHPVTSRVLEEHQLIVGVLVVVDPGCIPLSYKGEKLRILLRNLFITDSLNPIYVSYNI